MLFLLPGGEGQDEGGPKKPFSFLPAEAPACLPGDCRFGDTSAPVISPQHRNNRRVFSYGGGGRKVRR